MRRVRLIPRCGTLRRGAWGAFVFGTLFARTSGAWVIAEDPLEEASSDVGVVARSFTFLNAGPVLEPPLAPDGLNPAGQSVFDARIYASHKTADYRFVVHNQSSLTLASLPAAGALNLGRGVPPPRFFPLTFSVDQENLRLQNSTDWIFAELRVGALTFTVGRQPITFGRGSLFHTNDLVSTFSLTEVDRLFKPGADGIRMDWSMGDRQNLVVLGTLGDYSDALGASGDGSTALIQYKKGGILGEFAVLGGYVRGDAVLSLDGTTSMLGFDLYGELTTTVTTELSLDTPSVQDDIFVKALVGASLRPVNKLTITPEIFYGGNGASSASDYLPVLTSQRFQIGDQTTVGRYYAALSNLWEVTPLTSLTWGMMANLSDPSALWYGFLQQSISDDTSAQLGVYAPIGRLPISSSDAIPLQMQSEFGAYPYFFFAQLTATL